METFDAVIFSCPECNHEVQEHSRIKNNVVGTFHEDSVPKMVAETIIGNTVYCPSCGDRFIIMIDTHATTVPLFLRKG